MAKVLVDSTTGRQHEVDFDAVVNLMDDDIRERLHDEVADQCPDLAAQEFVDAYAILHADKFGERFVVD